MQPKFKFMVHHIHYTEINTNKHTILSCIHHITWPATKRSHECIYKQYYQFVFDILRFVHTIISRNSKTKSNGLSTLKPPPGYVQNHFSETQAKDCPILPEKYNNHIISQVEEICEGIVHVHNQQVQTSIFQKLKPNYRNFLVMQLNSHLL